VPDGTPMPPTDPLIYCFYKLVLVDGPACKTLTEEMSATASADPTPSRVLPFNLL
jgi:cyanate lyase